MSLSKGPHEYDIVSKNPMTIISLRPFDATSGERVSDAVVTAEVSELGCPAAKRSSQIVALQPMAASSI